MELITEASRFEAMAREHGEALLGWALQLTGDRGDALDLVQDTYERALRRGLEGVAAGRLRPWLFVIARNQFFDGCRARRRRRALIAEQVGLAATVTPDPPAEELPWQGVGPDDLRRAVEDLSPPLAQVYRLHAFERLDYAAIAARLCIPSRTVGTRLLRARRKLKAMLLARAHIGQATGAGRVQRSFLQMAGERQWGPRASEQAAPSAAAAMHASVPGSQVPRPAQISKLPSACVRQVLVTV
jgi:RNA polymerase sigma-70 factor (ECF subfamily)